MNPSRQPLHGLLIADLPHAEGRAHLFGEFRERSPCGWGDCCFKPRQMAGLLSIRSVFPRQGGRVWYDDQREAHCQIYTGDDVVDYAFMGTDPKSPDNRWLRDAMERQIPVIYFLGTSPGHYQPIRHSSSGGTRSAHGSSLLSERSWGPRLKLPCQRLQSAAMLFARSRRGCIRHHSGMQCSRLMGDGARSPIYRSLGCSMPLTSSWMRTSS